MACNQSPFRRGGLERELILLYANFGTSTAKLSHARMLGKEILFAARCSSNFPFSPLIRTWKFPLFTVTRSLGAAQFANLQVHDGSWLRFQSFGIVIRWDVCDYEKARAGRYTFVGISFMEAPWRRRRRYRNWKYLKFQRCDRENAASCLLNAEVISDVSFV